MWRFCHLLKVKVKNKIVKNSIAKYGNLPVSAAAFYGGTCFRIFHGF